MSAPFRNAVIDGVVVPIEQATISVASSAVLYGLSIYTVFPVLLTKEGMAAFRLKEHYERLCNSARIMGIDTFEPNWSYERFLESVRSAISANAPTTTVFMRATVHVSEILAGLRSRGLTTTLSMFVYESMGILPQTGARLKTSVWRRVPDNAIPARAKVTGAYVNSVLAKQDALDAGYDDCVFLDSQGHVCELSAANIFMVRDGVLSTPGNTSDVLEGISRKTVLEIAKELGIPTQERTIDLTELYIADEVFASGTSAFIAPVKEIDARTVGKQFPGSITERIRAEYTKLMNGSNQLLLTNLS